MVLFHNGTDTKYQLLETPKRKCSFVVHSWAIFGLVILSISITLISLIVIWDQIKQIQHKTETLDFLLFGPKREISDVTRFSEYRALLYALGSNNNSNIEVEIAPFKPNEEAESYQHIDKKYSLVCYYVTPSRSATSDKLTPSDIDSNMCTHIIVSFATIMKNRIHLVDEDIPALDAIAKLKSKNPNLKVLLSIVSFNSADQEFGLMVSNRTSRSEFINDIVEKRFTFALDGIDLDWEFPAWPPGKDLSQKDQFTLLLKEMRATLGDRFLITAAVAAPLTIIKQSYDVPSVAKYVDFVNVMTYDYHSYVWYLPIVGLNSPLYNGPNENGYFRTLNTNYTIQLWLQLGMPKNKIMVGMPLYGHSWTLADPSKHNIGDVAAGFGNIGEKGFVSYRDVCKFIQLPSVKTEFNGDMRAPYAYSGSEWFSYDNDLSLSYKAEYVTEHGLGGAMIFSLNQDDYEGKICGGGVKFPLLNRVKTVLLNDNL